jgi:hypothetical protein
MLVNLFLLLALLHASIQVQETVLGVLILHYHRDRTDKSWTPAILTDWIQTSLYAGTMYHNRYKVPLTISIVMSLDACFKLRDDS